MTTDHDILEYDAKEQWLVLTEPTGASAVLARDVAPRDAGLLIQAWNVARSSAAALGISGDEFAILREYLTETAYERGYKDGAGRNREALQAARNWIDGHARHAVYCSWHDNPAVCSCGKSATFLALSKALGDPR